MGDRRSEIVKCGKGENAEPAARRKLASAKLFKNVT
jgi:hypothetical protein